MGATWSRRDVSMTDGSGAIEMKLWNDDADLVTEEDVGKSVAITNVEVDKYKDSTQIRNTPETRVEVWKSSLLVWKRVGGNLVWVTYALPSYF